MIRHQEKSSKQEKQWLLFDKKILEIGLLDDEYITLIYFFLSALIVNNKEYLTSHASLMKNYCNKMHFFFLLL